MSRATFFDEDIQNMGIKGRIIGDIAKVGKELRMGSIIKGRGW